MNYEEDGGQLVNSGSCDDDQVLFYADNKKLKQMEELSLQIANNSNVPIKIEININPNKTKAVINILLLGTNKRI